MPREPAVAVPGEEVFLFIPLGSETYNAYLTGGVMSPASIPVIIIVTGRTYPSLSSVT